MNISLLNKNAVICGSRQGIGLAIAKELAGLGANCTLLARNETSLQQVVKSLDAEQQQQHNYLVADFTKPDEVKKTIETLVSKQTVHILINNTGGPKPGLISQEDEQKFMDAFSQHIVCNQILVKAVLPGMKETGYGRIVNIISTSVRIPIDNLGVSNTIRAAVASWAKTLSNEVAQFGITVNSILPGFTNTQRLESLIKTNADKAGITIEELSKKMKSEIPARRFGEASEIAAVAAFLCSPAASYVNGVTIPVDGGKTGTI
jgi:3-oxoacyl-[acyl-carrier protein] reductase